MANQVEIEEVNYPHEYIWRSACELLKYAETQHAVSYYFLLSSLLMYFMAYEAFLNYCGHSLRPELWEHEKANFKDKGMEGKLKAIIGKLPDFSWRKHERPYITILKLNEYRDLVAHGKVVSYKYQTMRAADGIDFKFAMPWDEYITIEYAAMAKNDIKNFCQSILIEMRKISDHHLHLIHDAFEGSLGSAIGSDVLIK